MTYLGKIEICSRIRDPLKKRFVPSIKLGPDDVCNLLLLGFFEENVEKQGSKNFRVALE